MAMDLKCHKFPKELTPEVKSGFCWPPGEVK